MPTNAFRAIVVLACLIPFVPPLSGVCLAQPQTRANLEAAVRERAREDARNRGQMASTQDLDLLFGREAAGQGVSLREVVSVYEDEFKKSKPAPPWYEPIKPNAGWIIAVLLFFLLILQDAVRKKIASWVDAVFDKIYYKLAGFSYFRNKILAKYRTALMKKYQRFPIPFGSERTLDMNRVYVPLKVKGAAGEEQSLEDVNVLSSFRRLMVVGAPGSGKSMFLKRIAFLYATGKLTNLPESYVPVLFDLRRLNDKDKSLEEHLVEIFALNGFKEAKGFVEAGLEEGSLLLLFDGLDEVNSAKRGAEVGKIRDLLDRHEGCPAVVTCRTAVYRNEFAGAVDRTLEIQEFTDSQIYQFLESWPNMPPEKSIDELMKNLRERPRIMALARNPLLLTIVTFLYSDKEEFVLPYYRTDFYDRAVNELLRNKETLNKYDGPPKYYVLQHLALFNQEKNGGGATGAAAQNDRLSLDVQTVLAQINQVLPNLNLKSDDALPLLKDIVERSGLLLELDNKTRYQFSHLTLQEYFTASALANDPERLLRNFEADRDAWRETVKLWCGQIQDSTELIKKIYEKDPAAAFECLADARVVVQAEAEGIINAFKPRLRDGGEDEDIVRAFAAVAAGTSQRSQYVFNYLVESLSAPPDDETFAAAAGALSGTNKPAAVNVLAQHLAGGPQVQAALVSMGDLAVPALAQLALGGERECVRMLHSIGTPQAAKSLVPLLWGDDKLEVTVSAAAALGDLLRSKSVEEALRAHPLNEAQRVQTGFNWVWEPFAAREGDPLRVIAGRIGWLINRSGFPAESSSRIDRRIAIPLLVALNEWKPFVPDYSDPELRNWFLEASSSAVWSNYMAGYASQGARWRLVQLMDAVVTQPPPAVSVSWLQDVAQSRHMALLGKLGLISRLDVIARLISDPKPTIDDWRNVLRPSVYDFSTGVHYRVILALLSFLLVFGVASAAARVWWSGAWVSVENAICLFVAAAGLLSAAAIWFAEDIRQEPQDVSLFFGGAYLRLSEIPDEFRLRKSIPGKIGVALLLAVILLFPVGLAYVCSRALLNFLPAPAVVAGWGLFLSVIFFLRRVGLREHRLARNPLHGVLEVPESEADIQELEARPSLRPLRGEHPAARGEHIELGAVRLRR